MDLKLYYTIKIYKIVELKILVHKYTRKKADLKA